MSVISRCLRARGSSAEVCPNRTHIVAVESGLEVSYADDMPGVYKISMVRMSGNFNCLMTDERSNVQVYTIELQKCNCHIFVACVRLSKILYYEKPCIVTGNTKHTGLKSNLRVYVQIEILERGKTQNVECITTQ